jgi:integrase
MFAARINLALKEGYRGIGLTHPYFYKRPSYALRHCGAHLWLMRTGYNYDAVASMGWEDINTLRLYYGKYDHTKRKQAYRMAY